MSVMKQINFILITCCAMSYAFSASLDHSQMHMDTSGDKKTVSPSTLEYQQGMEKMHDGMNIQYSGNADLDFARGMIPHHQAAIDMAKTQLKYGHDKKLRKMSEEIIKTQNAERRILQKWIEQHSKN